ncbi:hypothetical protein KQ940_22470 [Marinobacterium sp. D7]|uniref:tetratricopeptide repeat protein n=1 Tax=Marinobacterium ramblicola TaxID=2849041 RepID=UPI001C2DB44C|nr:hypothetical protein [Marinobacterium ramblicola]MBV1790836.1 hypothetical protein [Marinobacterium ramblicola]
MAFDKEEFVRDIEHAKLLALQGKADEAINYWRGKRNEYSGVGGQYEYQLGTLYLDNTTEYDKAILAYEDGLKISPPYPRLYIGMALAYINKHDYSEANFWADRAVQEYPNWWLGYHTKSQIAWNVGDYTQGVEMARESLRKEMNGAGFYVLAVSSWGLRDYETVAKSVEAAINLEPRFKSEPNIMILAAQSLAYLGREKDAYATLDVLQSSDQYISKKQLKPYYDQIEEIIRGYKD